ncbi:MAG: endonuclease/exonuclease/phosphatase family protein [Paracoccus sp. (in: a-proteobacteria)]|uniref:endonuclease/exonuclease/phosphatase family protein n=1 Tax=unclassified Paracoccus (in: a-proteobacteria) TaxID=2688777 RepID=UPI00237099DC|nr:MULTISPECIES: endonuclease/exonuclease/phosphatase family protein [unclassified Paracoccus (in: a-proteobacteria)]MDB2551259.1 endonuclease/exonuclease/phosphatase family protein [Paracoccus sp. (in: a-proteobacteria)]|tara:strand:+ start:9425 stop:10321 length:897 start_codon:yes stop_codon:yes gene_type:complete
MAILVLGAGLQAWNSRGGPVPPPRPGTLRIATMNIHYIALAASDDDRWSAAGWQRRRGAAAEVLGRLDADLIAFQEMESFRHGSDGSVNLARDDLLAAMPDFAAAASGDWRNFPSTQPIFYRKDRLRPEEQGWFFFSDTPEVIYSRSFDGSWPAFASWARFTDLETGQSLRLVNVHFDFRSGQNRLRSARLVASRIAPWLAAGEHVVVAGDLNAMAGSATADILRGAGLSLTPVRGSSFHFGRGLNLFGAIDHVLYDCDSVLTDRPVALRDNPGGRWPSDHYPVLAQIRLGDGTCDQP